MSKIRVSAAGFTVWLVWSGREGASRRRAWRGPLTPEALERCLATLAAVGHPGKLELATTSLGPVEMTIAELVDLGVLVPEEFAISRARAHFDAVERTSRRRRSPSWFVDAGEGVVRLGAAALARFARRRYPRSNDES